MPIFEPAYVLAATLALSGAEPQTAVAPQDLACLALNIYHEARGEPQRGQAAVAHVTLNRAADSRYPDTVCEVVGQQHRGICQFSWYCQMDDINAYDRESFRRSLGVALGVLEGKMDDPTRGATHFITTSMRKPGWARRLTQTATIGGHRFFRY